MLVTVLVSADGEVEIRDDVYGHAYAKDRAIGRRRLYEPVVSKRVHEDVVVRVLREGKSK